MGTGTLGIDFSVSELGMYITGYNNYDTWECIEGNSLRVMRSCTHFEVSILSFYLRCIFLPDTRRVLRFLHYAKKYDGPVD